MSWVQSEATNRGCLTTLSCFETAPYLLIICVPYFLIVCVGVKVDFLIVCVGVKVALNVDEGSALIA